MSTPFLAEAALTYASIGWRVLPLAPCEKIPARGCRHGCHDATTDRVRLTRWWARHPACNVGVATGAESGLVVIDIDGPEGEAAWVELVCGEVFVTLEQRTGRGRQLFFRHPGGRVPNRARLLPSLDVRADGGYVVVPPSVHPSGAVYAWTCRRPPLPLPGAILALLRPPVPAAAVSPPRSCRESDRERTQGQRERYIQRAFDAEIDAVSNGCNGSRNAALNKAAFSLAGFIATGELSEGLVCEQLLAAGLRAGLEERECRKTIGSGLRAGMARPR